VMRQKYERLVRLPTPRIVLIGGLNLTFGVVSKLLRSRTACEIVNLGFNGYPGVRCMLAEASPLLRRGVAGSWPSSTTIWWSQLMARRPIS